MSTDLFENPMGLCGFEFVEFAAPEAGILEPLFEKMGFSLVAKHRSKDVLLYRQGDINFIINREPRSQAAYFAAEHGPCACGMGFRVRNAQQAYKRALELGAQPVEIPTSVMELRLPAIKGIGGAPLYLIDRFEDGKSIYDIDFEFLPDVDRKPFGFGLKIVDHLTHNVYRGRMDFWANYYERLFNFQEIRYFDIKGEYTGLTSRAMTAPDGLIRIPLNEEAKQGGGQIERVFDRVRRRRYSAHCLVERRFAHHHRPTARCWHSADDRTERHLLRNAGRASARSRRAGCRVANPRYSAGRYHRRRPPAPVAANLLGNPVGPGVL